MSKGKNIAVRKRLNAKEKRGKTANGTNRTKKTGVEQCSKAQKQDANGVHILKNRIVTL